MKMNGINSWKSPVKRWKRIQLVLRVGRLSVLDIDLNWDSQYLSGMIMNYGFEITWRAD